MGAFQVLDVNHKGTNVSHQARRRRDGAGINKDKQSQDFVKKKKKGKRKKAIMLEYLQFMSLKKPQPFALIVLIIKELKK